MSVRAAGWIVFAAAFFALPLPLLGLEGSLVPPARYGQLAGAMAVLVALEGAGGVVAQIGGLFLGHVLVYAGLLGAATWVLGRFALAGLSPRLRGGVALVLAAGLLGLGLGENLYDTPFHHRFAHAGLLDLYR